MFYRLFALAGLLLAAASTFGQTQEILLYEDGKIPYNLKDAVKRAPSMTKNASGDISKVGVPSLTYYPAAGKPNGGAVLICPGGGYSFVSGKWEGAAAAAFVNKLGYAAFVLNYRLPDSTLVDNYNRFWVPLTDAIQGIRVIKENGPGLQIDPKRIGVMGFSAGGHLAGTLATIYDKHPTGNPSDRPAWAVLVYPVTSVVSKDNIHTGSRRNLMGPNSRADQDSLMSPALQVSSKTPPSFVVHSADDDVVPISNAINYTLACERNNVPCDLHIYATGKHGYSMGNGDKQPFGQWGNDLAVWLQGR